VPELWTLGPLAPVMESPKRLKIAVAVLGIALLVTVGLLAWTFWQLHVWRQTVDNLSEEDGYWWAVASSHAPTLRVYQMDVRVAETKGMPIFSGRRDGPFEVWLYPDYTELSGPSRYANRKTIDMFDIETRYIYSNKVAGRTPLSRPNTALEPTPTAP